MTEDQGTVFQFPAQVSVRSASDELLELVRSNHALDPKVLDEFTPFFWRALISNETLDAYYTRMRPSSLRNYAQEAEAGVSFQDAHNVRAIVYTLGRSLTGKFSRGAKKGEGRVEADFYSLLEMDPEIDRFVNKMRAGIVRDVSIGFYDGQFICSLCGRDMMTDWDCWHIPGWPGKVDLDAAPDPDVIIWIDEKEGRAIATADVENAHLAEVSGVYDGATPGAAILKAYRMAEAGKLKPDAARMIETRYRIHLPGVSSIHPVDLSTLRDPPQEKSMAPKEKEDGQVLETTGDPFLARVRDVLAAGHWVGLTDEEKVLDAIRTLVPLSAEVERLRPLADDGTAYRKDLVQEAVEAGGRAYGKEFAEETYRASLEKMELATIKRFRDDWNTIGDKLFPGGRQTVEADETAEETPETERSGRDDPSTYRS